MTHEMFGYSFHGIKEAYTYLSRDYIRDGEIEDNMGPVRALQELQGDLERTEVAILGCGPGVIIHAFPFIHSSLRKLVLADHSLANQAITKKVIGTPKMEKIWLPYVQNWQLSRSLDESINIFETIRQRSEVTSVDLFKVPLQEEKFEAVIVPFVAESITDNEEDFMRVLENVRLRTFNEAYFICLLNSTSWRASDNFAVHPAFPLSSASLQDNLFSAGFQDVRVHVTPTKKHNDWDGYAVAKACV